MRHSFALLALFLLTLLLPLTGSAQLKVEPGVSPQAAVANIAGRGVKVRGERYAGAPESIGIFSYAGDAELFGGGIVLSTGKVADMVGPNNHTATSTSVNTPGQKDLDFIAGTRTFDAAVLDFDFMTDRDSISFDFLFASEGYSELVTTGLKDPVAIVLKGPGLGNGKHLAVVPGTKTLINISSVSYHNNSRYYVSNNPFKLSGEVNEAEKAKLEPALLQAFQYDGMTQALSVGSRVKPMTKYHLQVMIADGGDGENDSALLLREGSLESHEQYWRVQRRQEIALQRRIDSIAVVQAYQDSVQAVEAVRQQMLQDSVEHGRQLAYEDSVYLAEHSAQHNVEEPIAVATDSVVIAKAPVKTAAPVLGKPATDDVAREIKLVFEFEEDSYFLSEEDEQVLAGLLAHLKEKPMLKVGLYVPVGSRNADLRYDIVRVDLLSGGIAPDRIFKNGFSHLSRSEEKSVTIERLEIWVR